MDSSPERTPVRELSAERSRASRSGSPLKKGMSRDFDAVKNISFDDLELSNMVGYGTTAEVYLGSWRQRTVAIKKMLGHRSLSRHEQVALGREIDILTSVEHPNLVRLYGVTLSEPPFCIVMEFCEGGSLFELLHNAPEVNLCLMQNIKMCADVASAMEYLHTHKPQILHRDLKSLNLLLARRVTKPTSLPVVKVTDFGFGKFMDEAQGAAAHMTKNVGTVHWMAPEVFTHTNYTEKVDVYSYGIVVFEIIRREPPFATMDRTKIQERVARGERPSLEAVRTNGCQASEGLVQLARDSWAQEARSRPSFTQIMQTLSDIHAAEVRKEVLQAPKRAGGEKGRRMVAEGFVSKSLARGPHSVYSL